MQVEGSSVAITGASSGIGRATALELARRGARLALASRRIDELETLAAECRAVGSPIAFGASVDVTDAAAVEQFATDAIDRLGGVDAWINNAGVFATGAFEDIPAEVFNRVIETNLIGYANGARAVLHHFRARGNGSLVNVASLNSHVPGAMTTPYTASKWGVYGFTEALRQELRDLPDVHVAVVSPAAIDTPIWQHAANYSGRKVRALSPTLPADRVAAAIVLQLEKPRRELIVGHAGHALAIARRFAPALADRWAAKLVDRSQFEDQPSGSSAGNVFEPAPDAAVSGGWRNGSS